MLPLTIVIGQGIAAEIGREVAPDRVDVVGAILRIVVLDQRGGAVDPEVMGLARVSDPAQAKRKVASPCSRTRRFC